MEVAPRKKYLQAIIQSKSRPMLKVDYSTQDVWERRRAWWKTTKETLKSSSCNTQQKM